MIFVSNQRFFFQNDLLEEGWISSGDTESPSSIFALSMFSALVFQRCHICNNIRRTVSKKVPGFRLFYKEYLGPCLLKLHWPMAKRLKLFGITYLVGKISRSNFYESGSIG